MNRTFFIWQAILTARLFLARDFAAAMPRCFGGAPRTILLLCVLLTSASNPVSAQDSIWITTDVPYSFQVTRTITGTKKVKVKVPLPQKDTIYIHDHLPDIGKMIWSEWGGSFQSFIDSAISSGSVAYIDKDVTPASTVTIDGDVTMIGNGCTITSINKNAFVLGSGKHTFKQFNIVQTKPDGIAFFTRQIPGILWTNYVQNVNIEGGGDGYLSARGGNDTAWAGTTIENSIIKVKSIGISVFSQDGPYKYLRLKNVQIKTDTTHNIYVHPAVSLWYDSVASLGAGKLMQHQYSGSGNGGYNTAKYSRFSRVYSNGKGFEMTSVAEGNVEIDSSEISPYVTQGIPPAKVWATNSRFYNAGNGITLRGTLTRCTGGAWPSMGDTLTLVDCSMNEVSMRVGGHIITSATVIDYMSVADRGNDFSGYFTNSVIKQLQDSRNGNGILILLNTPAPAAAYGQKYRPEIIQHITK